MTTTEAKKSGGFVVGESSIYVVGLEGEVTAHTDSTVTIGGFTLPTRMNAAGGVRYLSTEWPSSPETRRRADDLERDYNEVTGENEAMTEKVQTLLDALGKLHDEHHFGARRVCLHEVCRRFRI